jgi:hypothetical protein
MSIEMRANMFTKLNLMFGQRDINKSSPLPQGEGQREGIYKRQLFF